MRALAFGRAVERDSLLEALLREELGVANKHLPRTRKSLEELLSEEYPRVLCRDGTLHFFRKKELERISNFIDRESWDRILLPIIITIVPESESFVGVVEDRYAAELVSRILGLEYRGGALFLYKPQLYELRRDYSTIFQFAISYPTDLTTNALPLRSGDSPLPDL